MNTSNKNNDCIDAMIWVGSQPHQWQTIDEFVKEAELRGCCRHIPCVYNWMKFGKTKIFLASKDKRKEWSRGSLFGYFILNRVEIITEHKIAHSLPQKKKSRFLWPRDIQYYITYLNKLERKKFPELKIKSYLKKELQKRHIPNIRSGNTCKKPLLIKVEEKYIDLIEEALENFIENWLDTHYEDIIGCFPCNNSLQGEGDRGCSIRKGEGSVYAVDALCAAVHDKYRQLLRKKLYEKNMSWKDEEKFLRKIREENKESWHEWRKNKPYNLKNLINVYKGPFKKAVQMTYEKWRLRYPLDPRLKGKASEHGELVVFKSFPILERAPKPAYFRGILHIDGNKLIEQIANHTEEKALILTVHSCN